MANQMVQQLARDLKKASKKNDAPIWSTLAKLALKPSSAKRTINVNRISQLTKEEDIVVFPGKVLGTGKISHKITLFPFSISLSAATKILDSGGKIVNFEELVDEVPTGKGVVMLG